jgi:hypothetical protein
MKNKTNKQIFGELKKENFLNKTIQLGIIKEYKRDRQSHYSIKYINIGDKLEKRLLSIINNTISHTKNIEQYQLDGVDIEDGEMKSIDYEETDYFRIQAELQKLQPQDSMISGIDEFSQAKSYLIIIRNGDQIVTTAFKTLPESWKLKKAKGLIPVLFKDNKFDDMGDFPIFNISNSVDFLYYQDLLFVLSKKNFESGLNFREGMKAKAVVFYDSIEQTGLIKNIALLKDFVGDNQKYLRKLSVIENLSNYKDSNYIRKIVEIAKLHEWDIGYSAGKFELNESNVDTFLTLLQNKRLKSEITEEIFDVDSAKKVE